VRQGGGGAVKEPRAIVTDHAVLRHIQRVQGIDVEAVRRELGFKVDAAIEAGAAATVSDGIRYVLVEDRLVSCKPVKSRPLRGRSRRRRMRQEDEE
jgi:hypothetical protein